jgi:hypothetical protein
MDTDKDDMDKITQPRDNGADLRFAGERIAIAHSAPPPGGNQQRSGRWTELVLFRTDTGRFVTVEIGHTTLKGEITRRRAEVLDTPAEVIGFFGHGWLSKEIYRQAGIDAAVDV